MRILCGVVSLCLATSAFAAEPPVPKWGEVDQAVGQEKYADAKKSADCILQRGTPEDRSKTMLVYGCILLGLEGATQNLPMNPMSGFRREMQLQIYATTISRLL